MDQTVRQSDLQTAAREERQRRQRQERRQALWRMAQVTMAQEQKVAGERRSAEERAAAMQRPGGVGVRVGVCWRPERREWNGRRGARRGAWHERVQADVPRAVQGSCTRLRPRSTAILCQLEGLAPGDQPRTQLTA